MQFIVKSKINIMVIVVWILLYAASPLYMYYALLAVGQKFVWSELGTNCAVLTAYLVLFLLNHYILIPKYLEKKKFKVYIIDILLALAVFVVFLVVTEPYFHPKRMNFYEREQVLPPPYESHVPKEHMSNDSQDIHEGETLPDPREMRLDDRHKTLLLNPPNMARLIIAILMLGVDIGGLAWFKSQKIRQQLLLLEQQNLRQELEHLRYQINPHFFMNTLNNIHVLVDIDQERAKRAIIELSGLMRYSLYDGNNSLVPLEKEAKFLELFVSLMKMRYTDNVQVTCDLPKQIPTTMMMPPLLLATFVENAFKHGVSSLQPSYIDVRLTCDTDNHLIRFVCANSNHASATEDGHHGIGLENVRKRLDLQYADKYELSINDTDNQEFRVELTLDQLNIESR